MRRLGDDGATTLVALHRLRRGDRVRVLAGEAFPADGRCSRATTEVDEALLTGESRPVAKRRGDEAIAGSINLRGPVVQRVERVGADTRYEGIVALMRTAMTDRPPLLRAADRVAGPFLWGVLAAAPLAAGAAWSFIDPSRAVWVAVSVLIVTCPCALSLAAPSALLAAAGALVRRGVLVQRFDALEALAALDTICFDKTGTLTEAGPRRCVVELQPAAARAGLDEAAVRALAGALAAASTHPLVGGARRAAPAERRRRSRFVAASPSTPGLGVEAHRPDGRRLPARRRAPGRRAAARRASRGADGPRDLARRTRRRAGRASRFAEALRADARGSVDALRDAGLDDRSCSPATPPARVRDVARRLGIAERARRCHARPTSSPPSPRCRPRGPPRRAWSATASTTRR